MNPASLVLVIVIMLQVAGATVKAQEPNVNIGIGARSCGSWLRDRAWKEQPDGDPAFHAMMKSFVQGFLFAHWMQKSIASIPDQDALDAWMDNYCRANPLKTVGHAAIDLSKEISSRR